MTTTNGDHVEPPRLSDDEGDLAGALVASARGDAPSRHARERAAGAIGISLGVGLAATTTATTTKAATAGVAKIAAAGIWMKAGIGGVVAIAAVSTVVVAVQHDPAPVVSVSRSPSSSVAMVSASSPRPGLPSLVQTPPVVASEAAPPIQAATPAPPASATSARQTPPAPSTAGLAPLPSPSSSSASESALTREVRSIDDARRLLDHGDANGALAALDRHDQAFPSGPLQTEADILRAEALLARGDNAAAQKLARSLLARDPSGPHANRLRSIAKDQK